MWDFFIAHAGLDAAIAEAIYAHLAPHASVFLDTKCLTAGDDWDQRLYKEQANSRITVVLVSAHTDGAYYQREEIASAIQMARNSTAGHVVVPVLLPDEDSRDRLRIPYGLRIKQSLSINKGGLVGVCRELLRIKASLPQPPTSVRPRSRPKRGKPTDVTLWWKDQPDSKVLMLAREQHVLDIWQTALRMATGLTSGVHGRSPDEIRSVQDVLDVLSDGYVCIFLPLTLPRYNSLRIAELAHRMRSPTRVVTVTSTGADPTLFTPLFDGFISTSEFGVDSLVETLSSPIRRDVAARQLMRSIERILATASCFIIRHSHGDLRPTMHDYAAAAGASTAREA